MQKQTKKTAETPVSDKSTKSEILNAYQELLLQLENKDERVEITNEEQKAVEYATHETVEKIVKELTDLRLSANQTINSLTEQLTDEAVRFATIKKAIALVQKELEETQQVKIKASQLYNLIELHKKTADEFTKEITEKRSAWEEEQKIYEKQLSTLREREQEEYSYNQKLQHKRDTEAWEEEKRLHELRKIEEAKTRAEMLKELEELRKNILYPYIQTSS